MKRNPYTALTDQARRHLAEAQQLLAEIAAGDDRLPAAGKHIATKLVGSLQRSLVEVDAVSGMAAINKSKKNDPD